MSIYKTDGSNITSVANAIRNKAGISTSLSFPNGFVNAINAIDLDIDISDTTAVAGDVLAGKYFYDASGTKTQGTIANGTITNNTSGGTSSGTIQIKIGAGYYANDTYYTAQANSGTKRVSQGGTINVDGYTYASVDYGSIELNVTGGSSSGTIGRGKQIKIGAGYFSSDTYYTAASNSGTKNITTSGITSVDGYANVSVPKGAIVINVTATSDTTLIISNSNITANHYVYNTANTALADNLTWTTSDESITLSCSGGIPAMKLMLCLDM